MYEAKSKNPVSSSSPVLRSSPLEVRKEENVTVTGGRDLIASAISHADGPTTSVNPTSAGHLGTTLRRFARSQPEQAAHSVLRLQRQCGNQYVQRMLALARSGEGEADVTPDVEKRIESARGGGHALDSSVRRPMESAFGTSFEGVRVHTNNDAHQLNESLGAVAFATGKDIFFGSGRYDPNGDTGRELLAHELTHVVQQSGSGIQGKMQVGAPGDALEVEADQVAKAVMKQINPQSEEEDKESVPASSKKLQRKCSCGEHSGSGGECEECKAKHAV